MNKTAIILVGTILLLLVGCPSPVAENPGDNAPPVGDSQLQATVVTDVKGFPKIEEGYGLYGATVTMDGVYPGYSNIDSNQSIYVTIVNGNDQARIFHLSLQQPGEGIKAGYEPFPIEYFDWIVIEDISPWVAAGDIGKIPVAFNVPEDLPDKVKGKKYEVRILVEDWSQAGFVQIALQEKWLITFAE